MNLYIIRSSNMLKSFAVAIASPNAVCLPSTLILKRSKASSDEIALLGVADDRLLVNVYYKRC